MAVIQLRFNTDEEADFFIGQLFDGIGENEFRCAFVNGDRRDIVVRPDGDLWKHHEKLKRLHPEWFKR